MSIMSKLFCRDDIGIDLGAANMRVWVGGEGLSIKEVLIGFMPVIVAWLFVQNCDKGE